MNSQRSILVLILISLLFSAGLFLFLTKSQLFQAEKITEEACIELAKSIELSVIEENPEVLNNSLSHFAFLTKVADNIGYRNKAHLARLSIQIRENIRFGDMVMGYLKRKDGYFNFTRLYYKRKTPHLVFRIYSQTEGLNYFDCEVQRVKGELKIADVYIYYSGELWSTSYTRHMKLMEDYNLGDVDRIHPENRFYINIMKLDTINQMLLEGAVEQADALYQSIPDLFKKDKVFRAVALRIASQYSNEAYSVAIQNYIALDPQDESFRTFFKVLRSLFEKANFQTRESIQSLAAITGEDALMRLFIGQSYQNEQNFKKAIELYDQVILQYPDLFETYWYKLGALIETGEFDKAVEFLKAITLNFDARVIDLEEILLEYPEFLDSDPYRTWRGMLTI